MYIEKQFTKDDIDHYLYLLRDLSDIVGILETCRQDGNPITEERVDSAMTELYDGWDKVDEYIKKLYHEIIHDPDVSKKYAELIEEENTNKALRMEELKRK